MAKLNCEFLALAALLLLRLRALDVTSFQPTSTSFSFKYTCKNNQFSRLSLSSSGKGFGTPPPPPKPPKQQQQQQQAKSESSSAIADGTSTSPSPVSAPLSPGQITLAEMRRQKAEERDRELRKVKELREVDKAVAEAPAAIPEKVAMRMGQRMLPLGGGPLFLGLGSFVAFWYLATYKNMEFEPLTVAVSTIGLLVVGLFGITYSIFSTSWDEDREGDLLGLEEAKRNLDNVREGLGRSRENAILRENMSGLSEAEIERAIEDLDRRDARKQDQ